MKEDIDTDLYSRQIGTFGMETMGKLIKLNVLIVGMRGLGVEVAKNIILSGPKSVTIYDEAIACINDLSSNFFISEEDVGKKKRDEACINKLKELNPYVHVNLMRFTPTSNFLDKIPEFDIIVFTEFYPTNFLISVDAKCREHKKKFIYACNLGLVGYIFSDFGAEHIIFDESGSNKSVFNIKNISKSEKCLITIDNEKGQNNFNIGEGGYITFSGIEGMTELN